MASTVKDTNKIPELIKQLRSLKKYKTRIGIEAPSGDRLYMIGYVHEFGFDITVTDAMRGWFLANGMPLRSDTTKIRIPEKAYFRSGFDRNKSKIEQKMLDLAGDIVGRKKTAFQAREELGDYASGFIKASIDDVQLIESGKLRESIGHRVMRK